MNTLFILTFFIRFVPVVGISGSIDTCSNGAWGGVRNLLIQSLSFDGKKGELASSSLRRLVNDLGVFNFDGNDCWFGFIIPSIFLSSTEMLEERINALMILLSVDWQFWILNHPWRPLDVLLSVSKRGPLVGHLLPSLVIEESASRIELDILGPNPSTGSLIQRAIDLTFLGLYEEQTFVGMGYAILESCRILRRSLISVNSAETASYLFSKGGSLLWKNFIKLRGKLESSLNEYTSGYILPNFDEQLSYCGRKSTERSTQLSHHRIDYSSPNIVHDYSTALLQPLSFEKEVMITNEDLCVFAPAFSPELRSVMARLIRGISRVLEETGIIYTTVAGTVLGVHRFQEINPWEHDCDLCIDEGDAEKLLLLVLEMILRPEQSILVKHSVCLLLNARKGISHKFYYCGEFRTERDGGHEVLQPIDCFLRQEESPFTKWGYPYGDIQECFGFSKIKGITHMKNLEFGIRDYWSVDREMVLPLKRDLLYGVSIPAPKNSEMYISAYLESVYDYSDNWQNICRGHRGNNTATYDLDSLAVWYKMLWPITGYGTLEEIRRIEGLVDNIDYKALSKLLHQYATISRSFEFVLSFESPIQGDRGWKPEACRILQAPKEKYQTGCFHYADKNESFILSDAANGTTNLDTNATNRDIFYIICAITFQRNETNEVHSRINEQNENTEHALGVARFCHVLATRNDYEFYGNLEFETEYPVIKFTGYTVGVVGCS